MWGHVMIQVGHAAYQSICICEGNTLEPSPVLYLCSIKSNRKQTNLTSYDPERPEEEVLGSIPTAYLEWLNIGISGDK